MNYETFMQKIIAVGIAANYIARASPVKFRNCRDAATKADEIIRQLVRLPTWKKWILNRILRNA